MRKAIDSIDPVFTKANDVTLAKHRPRAVDDKITTAVRSISAILRMVKPESWEKFRAIMFARDIMAYLEHAKDEELAMAEIALTRYADYK